MSVAALTRLEREQNKQGLDSLTGLVQGEFTSLEGWVKSNAQKHIDKLTKILKTDLSDTDIRWECKAQIDIIASLKGAWQKKLDFIKSVLTILETEVLRAPLAACETDEDTSEHRLFTLRKLVKVFDEAKQLFARRKVSGKRRRQKHKVKTTI